MCPQRLCCARQLPHENVHLPQRRLSLDSGGKTKNHVKTSYSQGTSARVFTEKRLELKLQHFGTDAHMCGHGLEKLSLAL